MLRFKILASVVTLMVAALLAHTEPISRRHAGITAGDETLQTVTSPSHANLHISPAARETPALIVGERHAYRRSASTSL
jgi:hypothetical protein